MMWSVSDRVERAHSAVLAAPDLDLFVMKNSILGGRGSAVQVDGRYVWSRSLYPTYIYNYYNDNTSADRWGFDSSLKPIRVKDAFCVMHFNYGYGHWLTEIFPKLFVVKALRALGIRAPIAWPKTAHAHLLRRSASFLANDDFLIYDPSTEMVQAETLYMPGSGGHDHFFHPALSHWFSSCAQVAAIENVHRKIYVSRSKLNYNYGFRKLENAGELEGVAGEFGVELYYPEQDDPQTQINVFAAASLVVGEYGSGIHNAIFSNEGTKVIALNWINSVQSRIANLMGHRVGYILPPDGQPRLFRNDGAVETYTIDAHQLRNRLAEALDQ
jgi:O-antigen biosynthesis protein WbqL